MLIQTGEISQFVGVVSKGFVPKPRIAAGFKADQDHDSTGGSPECPATF
jgi:hypothetical protein